MTLIENQSEVGIWLLRMAAARAQILSKIFLCKKGVLKLLKSNIYRESSTSIEKLWNGGGGNCLPLVICVPILKLCTLWLKHFTSKILLRKLTSNCRYPHFLKLSTASRSRGHNSEHMTVISSNKKLYHYKNAVICLKCILSTT